jgi:poly(3-hydroxybutyrate) depolymerase
MASLQRGTLLPKSIARAPVSLTPIAAANARAAFFALCRRILAVLVFALISAVASAKDDKVPEVDAPAKVKPGSVGLLKSAGKGMRYFLRVPRRYDSKSGARLIVFLHGSSMNGLMYLRSFEAKKWCEDDILCCPNGENGSDPYG